MRFEKLKTEAGLNNAYAHNYRQYKVKNADPSKSDYNEELIELPKGETYLSMYKNKIAESPAYAGIRPRKDAVKGIEVMLTYNAKTVDTSFSEKEWKKENVQWLQDKFGKENVISAVLHKDEATPHIHAIVIPMVNGKLNAKHYTGGKKALQALQTSYGKCMEKVGLERGLKYSQAEHTDISKYYAALNQVVSKELPLPEERETAAEYRKRANKIFIDSNLKHFAELNEKDRKIAEARTGHIQEKIELEELRENKVSNDREKRMADRFNEIIKGLHYGYFPTREENELFKKQMQDISAWVQQKESEIQRSDLQDDEQR